MQWMLTTRSHPSAPRHPRQRRGPRSDEHIILLSPRGARSGPSFHKSQALGGRLTDINDIGPLVDFLAKDLWITGQVIFCELVKARSYQSTR